MAGKDWDWRVDGLVDAGELAQVAGRAGTSIPPYTKLSHALKYEHSTIIALPFTSRWLKIPPSLLLGKK
jgi:hypothetical protein